MRIDLTVRGPDGVDADIAVLAPPGATFGALAAELRRVLGATACVEGWWSGPRPLTAEHLLGTPGLRSGSVLTAVGTTGEPGAQLDVAGGVDAGRVLRGSRRRIVVGRAASCDLSLDDDAVSREHVAVEFDPGGATVRDLGATHPALLDAIEVGPAPVRWPTGALLRVGHTHLALAEGAGGPAASTFRDDGTVAVLPAKRARPDPPAPSVPAPPPGTFDRPSPLTWCGAIVAMAVAVGLAVALGSAQFLAFALLSPVTLLVPALIEWVRNRRRRRALADGDRPERDRPATARELTGQRRADHPGPADLLRIASGPAHRLWERARDDPALLRVRIGLTDEPHGSGVLWAVPATVDLRAGPLGIVAPPGVATALARWLVAQLAVHAAPTDVRLAGAGGPQWAWTRWLPHCGSPSGPSGRDGSWTVLVLDGDDPRRTAPLAAGVTAICSARTVAELPVPCAAVITADDAAGARLRLDGAVLLGDQVTPEWADRLARALAPLIDVTADGPDVLPAACRLGDLLGPVSAEAVSARWQRSNGRADAVVGVGADGPVSLDLERDGPHLLVGGTTGAGKSLFLQTLVTSLASGHPPDELTFVLVDYKGGAAFAGCAGLPHVVGVVTDLDHHLTRRALASLEAELRRRERLLATAGAADLQAYRAARTGPPLARLVLIVDEFATLRTELPDFLAGLTSIARRGRSLGVHLILATQRPTGAVTPEIRANCSLRIALRTTDAADSRDLVDVPDAAWLPGERPGRGLIWSGGTVRTVQFARPDEPASGDAAQIQVVPLGPGRHLPPRPATGPNDLRRIVAACAAASVRPAARSPWLPPLPDRITWTELPKTDTPWQVPLGLVDVPARQQQHPLVLDLAAGGSVLLAGAARSGRTTALVGLGRAAAARLEPARLHVHAIDPVGDLATGLGAMPHLGTITSDPEIVAALLAELHGQPPATEALATLLLVDGWEAFTRTVEGWDGESGTERLLELARLAGRRRLTVALTGERPALAPRTAGAFDTTLLLRLPDRSDYALAGVAAAAAPHRMPPGRALRVPDGTEIQLARLDQLAWLDGPGGAARLSSLDRVVRLDGLPARPDALVFAVAVPRAAPVGMPRSASRFLVAGPPRSGRSTVLRTLLSRALAEGSQVCVVAPRRSPLNAAARSAGLTAWEPSYGQAAPDDLAGLLLVDDAECFADGPLEAQLVARVRAAAPGSAVVVAARADELALSCRGAAHEVRRERCGLLLRPGRGDGALLGASVRTAAAGDPPGRGVLVADGSWGSACADGPVRVQVATP